MCGRGRCTLRPEEVARACCYRPSYNVSPGAYLPVVAKRREKKTEGEEGGGESSPVLVCMKWGLVPSFTKKTDKPDHYRMFNARSESIREKASFRRLIPKNRCLVAMEGFYEWKKDGSKKQPYYIYFKDGRPLVFAALYDSWHNSEGEVVYTFTILTTCSSSALQWLHDRMPVILGDKTSIDIWLNGSASEVDSVAGRPYEGPDLVWHPVTAAMGKPSFDGPECVKEIQSKPAEKGSLSKFLKKHVSAVHEIISPQSATAARPESVQERHGLEDVKEEEDAIVKREFPAGLQENEKAESRTHIARPPKEALEEYSKKRGYGQPLSDSVSPAVGADDSKKKGKIVKSAGGEQATLFSYFGRS
ncbi:unnamed protein product [Spirodela intermedia]|uniref:Uncharacterized protein n=1 Tax=Spirodela intermedia TaxID=51605 RepID=A0A7I8KGE8_SPIIN|nr:unnamed protein product [Spirodela intermedia]